MLIWPENCWVAGQNKWLSTAGSSPDKSRENENMLNHQVDPKQSARIIRVNTV